MVKNPCAPQAYHSYFRSLMACNEYSYLLYAYLLDWYDGGECCADPPVMSQVEMTKGPSVFFSDNMRRHDHRGNINHDLRFAHLRICDN